MGPLSKIPDDTWMNKVHWWNGIQLEKTIILGEKILSQRHFTHHKPQKAYLCASTMGKLQVTNSAMAQDTVNITFLVSYVPFVGFNSVTQRDVRISQIFYIGGWIPQKWGIGMSLQTAETWKTDNCIKLLHILRVIRSFRYCFTFHKGNYGDTTLFLICYW